MIPFDWQSETIRYEPKSSKWEGAHLILTEEDVLELALKYADVTLDLDQQLSEFYISGAEIDDDGNIFIIRGNEYEIVHKD